MVGVSTAGTDMLKVGMIFILDLLQKYCYVKFGTWTQAQTAIPFTTTVREQQYFSSTLHKLWIM